MKTLSRLLLSLLGSGLLFSVTLDALAARNYLVELVVFTIQHPDNNESWTSIPPPLSAKKMSRAIMPGNDELLISDNLKELEESNFSYYLRRISANPQRKVLLSTRWVQTVLGPADTPIVRITDARNTDKSPKLNNAPAGMLNNQVKQELPQLDGFINFYLNGHYTLEADIRFNPPYRPSILDEQPDVGPLSYRIHEKRRIKSGELNYYDHPLFGMVLRVTPVKTLPE